MSPWPALTAGVHAAALSTFGQTVTYTPAGLSPLELVGIFRAQSNEIDPTSGLSVSSTKPVLHVRRSDLPAEPTQKDRVTIGGTAYRVSDVQPDGEGMLLLRLLEA